MALIDPIALSQALIRCKSVTPEEAGVLTVLEEALAPLGARLERLLFEEAGTAPVENLYARVGDGAPFICFAGHVDVVPEGDHADWSVDPFAAEVQEGVLIGRGAVDMKPAIAAWVAAMSRFMEEGALNGSIGLIITGDEEGPAINGTRKMLPWMEEQGETPDACVVGEPTNPTALGEMIKIGRRGSVSFHLVVEGKQGHVAYPDQAENPIPLLVSVLNTLLNHELDAGTAHFPPSNLEVTSVDVGNAAGNVIPARAQADFNIRFNDTHDSAALIAWVEGVCEAVAKGKYTLSHRVTGEAFLTEPGALSALVAGAVQEVTGKKPELSTTGGTSDARFIKDICPVVECGLINATAHQVDEQVAVADIEALTQIYHKVLTGFFT